MSSRAWSITFAAALLACQGPSGRTGPGGGAGPAGPAGEPGPAGPVGAAGPRGPTGTPGAPGEDGRDGRDGADGQPGWSAGGIAGRVLRGAAPVPEASVRLLLTEQRVRTGADGRFVLADVPIGVHHLVVESGAPSAWTSPPISVAAGLVTEVELVLDAPRTGFLTGRVTTTTGEPLPGAVVRTDFGDHRAVTGADGRWSIEVPPTRYTVSAWSPGLSLRTATAEDVAVTVGATTEVTLALAAAPLDAAQHVGSGACRGCHAEAWAAWAASPHARALRPTDLAPADGAVIVAPWEGAVQLGETTFELGWEEARPIVDITSPAGERARHVVERVHGAGRWQQQYQVRIDGAWYVLPIRYEVETARWTADGLDAWITPEGGLRRPDETFATECQGCHSTALRLTGEDVAHYVELNIGCERCHGPGSHHVLAPRADNIVSPRRLLPADTAGVVDAAGQVLDPARWDAFRRAQALCGACHARGRSALTGRFAFPWDEAAGAEGQVPPGGDPAPVFASAPEVWGDTRFDDVPSPRAHYQQAQDLEAAGPGGHANNPYRLVTCFDCHAAHGGGLRASLRQPADDNGLCLSCHGPHGFADEAAISRHTRHASYAPGTTGAGQCIGCHMPRTGTRSEPGDVSSHTFRVIAPHESVAMAAAGETPVPNSCDGCHTDDEDFGALRFQAFFGQPVERP